MDKKLEYVIRKAEVEDCKEIYQMIVDMAVYEKMEDQVKVSLKQLEKDGFGPSPKYHAFVVESVETKKLIGYSIFYYVYSTWKGQIGYLEDLYVEEQFRKRGIGTYLIKKVVESVLSEGCSQCRLACLKWNTGPLRLYQSLGAKNLTEIEDWLMLRFDLKEMQAMTT